MAGIGRDLFLAAGVASALILAPSAKAAPSPAKLAAWTGVWVIADSFMDKQDGTSVATGGGRPNPKATRGRQKLEEPVFKGEYLKRFEARKAAELAAEKTGKPMAQSDELIGGCGPIPFVGQWMTPYATELTMGPSQMILYQEAWQQVRHIYIDGRKHPDLEEYDFRWKGNSIGHWEGDTLVIDTTGIRVGSATYSDKLHVVERYQMIAPDYLSLDVVAEDPEALARPRKLHYDLHRKLGMEVMDYDCQENNRNPADANGNTLTILKDK